jgi:hypothetical protein
LKYHLNATVKRACRRPPRHKRQAGNFDLSLPIRRQACEHAEQGRLAGAGSSHETECLPRTDAEIGSVDSLEAMAANAMKNVDGFD